MFRSAPDGFLSLWRSALFNVFLFLGPVVILSLLISILGDTYDRVKLTQEAELFKVRARMVRTCAAWSLWTSKILYLFRPAFKLIEQNLHISRTNILRFLFTLLLTSLALSFAGWLIGWYRSFVGLVQVVIFVPLFAAAFHYKFWFK